MHGLWGVIEQAVEKEEKCIELIEYFDKQLKAIRGDLLLCSVVVCWQALEDCRALHFQRHLQMETKVMWIHLIKIQMQSQTESRNERRKSGRQRACFLNFFYYYSICLEGGLKCAQLFISLSPDSNPSPNARPLLSSSLPENLSRRTSKAGSEDKYTWPSSKQVCLLSKNREPVWVWPCWNACWMWGRGDYNRELMRRSCGRLFFLWWISWGVLSTPSSTCPCVLAVHIKSHSNQMGPICPWPTLDGNGTSFAYLHPWGTRKPVRETRLMGGLHKAGTIYYCTVSCVALLTL